MLEQWRRFHGLQLVLNYWKPSLMGQLLTRHHRRQQIYKWRAMSTTLGACYARKEMTS